MTKKKIKLLELTLYEFFSLWISSLYDIYNKFKGLKIQEIKERGYNILTRKYRYLFLGLTLIIIYFILYRK